MALLIDPPRWPAHGTRFSHLVSDASLGELLEFADSCGLPVRAFDHDHYDVPERRWEDMVAAGARPTSASTLVRRLVASGLRVRPPERTPKAGQVLPRLRAAWAQLLPGGHGLGVDLLRRWQEPHRHYHDVRHLDHLLGALAVLSPDGVPRPVLLAAWFHDAVHDGVAGADEEASALLAEALLPEVGVPAAEVAEVARLIRLTVRHDPEPGDAAGALLADGDLSVLGLPGGRYHVYVRDVRLEYPDLPDALFSAGRLQVVERLSSTEPLYRMATGERLWAVRAARNLAEERSRWSRIAGSTGYD